MREYLLLVFEGTLMAFGGEVVDARGVVRDFPGASTISGLLGNAIGYRRTDDDALTALQARLHYAARIDREGVRLTDFQTAELARDDKGWTTRGAPETRFSKMIGRPGRASMNFLIHPSMSTLPSPMLTQRTAIPSGTFQTALSRTWHVSV